MNLNGYDESQYRIKFSTSDWAVKLSKILGPYAKLSFEPCWDAERHNCMTPRETAIQSVFSATSLYYIEFLLEKDPKVVVDIGCGGNIFKKIIPMVHGIDPTPGNLQADENDYFDEQFSNNHVNSYESVFSINSIHYVSLKDFKNRFLQFYNVVKPGGRGFVTFNTSRMLELTDPHDVKLLFGTESPSTQQLTEYIENIVQNLSIKFLVIDILINNSIDEIMNGNIRLVFEK